MSERLITALSETWKAIRALLSGVEGDAWHLPTPCTEWDVHDLAAHLGAVEGMFQGLPQPEFTPPPSEGIDAWTAVGVQARRDWSAEAVQAEVEAASDLQLARLRELDAAGWEESTMGPIGPTTKRGLAEIRLFDLYLHLLDLRFTLGHDLAFEAQPNAFEAAVDRVVELTPWGVVKKAGIGDGARIRLDLAGPSPRTVDVVVEGGRGAVTALDTDPTDTVTGPAGAYLLVATGRLQVAEAAGGVVATGDDAVRLLEGFRVFA